MIIYSMFCGKGKRHVVNQITVKGTDDFGFYGKSYDGITRCSKATNTRVDEWVNKSDNRMPHTKMCNSCYRSELRARGEMLGKEH